MSERAKYIPLRLTYDERKLLRLAEAALKVSNYTNVVDDVALTEKDARRRQKQLQNISAMLAGLVVACDYMMGQDVLEEGNWSQHEAFFQTVFEIARRYKVMNPEKMRSEYGKMLYLLQDGVSASMQAELGLNLVKPIKTVHTHLSEMGGLALLDDAVIEIGTQEILPDPSKSRAQIQTMIKRKERAVAHISTKYLSASLTKDDIERCLYSICDNNRRARSLFERARATRDAPPPFLARAQLSQFESAADRQDDRAAQ